MRDNLEKIIGFAKEHKFSVDEAKGFYRAQLKRNRRKAYDNTLIYIYQRAYGDKS